MIINHNMASLNTYRQLSTNNVNSSKSLEKLSSGLRINKAGDDAAGLAISEKMRGQIRGLDQATRNAQDSISMIQTAEGSLSETHSILQRMKELATQAANDTNVGSDRSEIQKEINQLTSEINRIGNTTEFNTQKLLNGAGVTRSEAVVDTTTAGAAKGAISALQTVTVGTAKANAQVTVSGKNSADDAAAVITIDANGSGKFAGAAGQGLMVEFKQGTTGQAAEYDAASKKVTIYGDLATGASVTNLTASLTAGGLNNDITLSGANGATDQLKAASSSLLNGGQDAVEGVYSFDIEILMKDTGTTAENSVGITGSGYTAAAAASVDIHDDLAAHSTKEEQAELIAAAFNADLGITQGFTVTSIGSTIQFTQKTAGTGTLGSLTSTTTATQGDFDINIDSLVADGGKYVIDGNEIKVTSDASDEGIADGTAILVGADKNAQAANLAVAVTRNANLKDNYVATNTLGENKVNLVQRAGKESATAPDAVSYSNDGKFEAKFQIGANTAQSMTVEINDMRSAALKISGNDAGGTVTAANGSKATYKAVQEVTDGTNNTSAEYALDVSDHDKATAAISVIEDAIISVSAERSKLGAYSNRLEHTITNLGTSSENLTAAESRIRDVDMAKEMMNFQKNNILSQAAQAMLAQANQAPQGVLQLLR